MSAAPNDKGMTMRNVGRRTRFYGLLGIGLAGTVTGGAAFAQNLPPTTACPEAVASIATCYGIKHESGAYILAAMPKTWNGDLVVFAHGGPSLSPPTAKGSKSDLAKYAFAVQRGYGWVASSYRREGYGVAMAASSGRSSSSRWRRTATAA